jgi:exosome complex component RRP43
MKVAYQGEPGAYSEQAINELLGLGDRFTAVGYDSFDAAFAATQSGEADFLLAPIENTLGGTIHANCDLQLRHNLFIIGEHNLRVRHCLMALPGSSINDIKKAISHPQALAQCDTYLRNKNIIAEAQYDTAGSAKMIATQKMHGVAAIASELAAQHYGLDILERGIEDDCNNFTRFLLLRTTSVHLPPGIQAKTSLVFSMKANVAGALFKALSVFALRDIDLSKIESRPCKPDVFETLSLAAVTAVSSKDGGNNNGKNGGGSGFDGGNVVWMSPHRGTSKHHISGGSRFKYLFYADLLTSVDDPNTANALRHLQEITTFFRVLGSYPRDGVLVGLGSSVPGSPKLNARAVSPGGTSINSIPSLESSKIRVGILGFGNFGQFLAQKLLGTYDVFAHSRTDYTDKAIQLGVKFEKTLQKFLLNRLDIIIVAVSILSFQKVMEALCEELTKNEHSGHSRNALIVDVLSVKCHAKTTMLALLPDECDILCTHPMFGPESGKHGWAGLPFVYERVRLRNARRCEDFVQWWAKQGCRMEDMTCELHDKCSAGSQFVTHFTGRVLAQMSSLRTTPINTKGFDSLLHLVDNTCKDSFDLFFALYKYNPSSENQLCELEDALKQVANNLRSGSGTSTFSSSDGGRKIGGGTSSSNSITISSKHSNENNTNIYRLNPRVQTMKPSATGELNDKTILLRSSGKSIIGLNVGEPDYLPHETVLQATENAARNPTALKYSPTAGTVQLRQAICDWYLTNKTLEYNIHNILISSGAKQSIYQAIQVCCSPGDEVIIPVPYWVSYPLIVKAAGAVPVFVQTSASDDWQLNPKVLRKSITSKTRIVMITNPSNPTGAVLQEDTLNEIAAVLREPFAKHVIVLADEIYSELLLENDLNVVPFATLKGMKNRTLTINGFSKNWAMTGYRVGWLAGPVDIIKNCVKYQSQVTSCACSLSMAAAHAAISQVPRSEFVQNNTTLRQRRDRLVKLLTSVNGVVCPKTQGAFYLFVDISALIGAQKRFQSSADVCLWLLDMGVALVPGEPFGVPGCVRISYTASDEMIELAGQTLKKAFEELSLD